MTLALADVERLIERIGSDLILSFSAADGDRSFEASFLRGERWHRGSGRSLEKALNWLMEKVPHKRCSRCGELRALIDFNTNNGHSDGLASHCKECDRERKKKWYPRSARKKIKSGVRAAQVRAARTQNPPDN